MPTAVFINEHLALRVQLHTGAVSLAEFEILMQRFYADRRVFLYDVIHLLDETTTFTFGVKDLPTIKQRFRGLIQTSSMPLILRSAWVCPSPSAWRVLEAWLHERHSFDGLNTEPCLVATLDETAGLFDQDELRAVQTMRDFKPYFSIEG